ncbi:type II toxin-antitoxin system VapC family toxin [Thermococcus waiotapuensis]|uniref:Type II toxin-antitoxin system VapC family toxin n=1 Tax=Thermococcus waiotapuensis TaxID=90909 RepID=A0AAE4T3A6_9EURY|nr:type II toxin-antitoxin system VapC family toxin [Thermococcus waiotapuensis]MDV3103628.1 type II toxin-antitoxin system VapC family toxin [Thermococcus waiotapuensis]
MKMPKRILFDSSALLRMHTKRNKDLLELALMKFEILVPQLSVYEYLFAKAFLGKNPDHVMAVLKELYHIVPLDDEIIIKSAIITKNLLKSRTKRATGDILVGVTAIVKNALLITDNPELYDPLKKYGLDVISTEKFIGELEQLFSGLSKGSSEAIQKQLPEEI